MEKTKLKKFNDLFDKALELLGKEENFDKLTDGLNKLMNLYQSLDFIDRH